MRLGYTAAHTYTAMLRQAAPFFDEGKPAILDASYLRRQVREGARAFAERAGVRFVAVERLANEPLVRERLHRRRSAIWNPSGAAGRRTWRRSRSQSEPPSELADEERLTLDNASPLAGQLDRVEDFLLR